MAHSMNAAGRTFVREMDRPAVLARVVDQGWSKAGARQGGAQSMIFKQLHADMLDWLLSRPPCHVEAYQVPAWPRVEGGRWAQCAIYVSWQTIEGIKQ